MIDIKEIRDHFERTQKKLLTKDSSINLLPIYELDISIRHLKTKVEELKAKRNSASKEIGEMKRKGLDATEFMKEIASLGDEASALDKDLSDKEAVFKDLLARIPNLPMDDIPVSPDPKDNVCIKSVGNKREFSFAFKNHVELNEGLKLFDFKRGAKISGSGWPVYSDKGARLEWALIQYMLSIHLKNGFTPWMVPHLVRPEIVFGSGQLPKFSEQIFKLSDDQFQLYLLPTAEVAVCGLHFDETIPPDELPKKYVSYTPCFRREAGAAGSNERGLIRTHQFNKVEMFAFTKPENSESVFEEMLASAEEILQGLGLHYRNMLLTTGDMSFAAAKTIDVEVWLPGQNRYYEVSSVSNCTDYQARRSQIKTRTEDQKTQFVHTLNGSGLATSRLMVALLENNQEEDGSISLPAVLRPYLGFDRLTP